MLELLICQDRKLGSLRQKTRTKPAIDARRMFCVLAAERLGHNNQSYTTIGEYLGYNRNTVRHAISKFKNMMYFKRLELLICQDRMLKDLQQKTKLRQVVEARWIFCLIAAEKLGHGNDTYKKIAEYLKCDRNTVRHSVKRGKDIMIYSDFRMSVNNIKNELWKQ